METLFDFVRKQPTKRFERHETIIQLDTVPQAIYAVRTGFVKGFDITTSGQEQLVWLGGPNDVFPVGWLFDIIERTQFIYSAFSDCEVHIIMKDDFLQFLQNNNEGTLELARQMSQRYYELMERIRALEQPKASDKIAHTIYFLAQHFSLKDTERRTEIPLPLTHQDMANLLGLTRETVAVELKRLKDAKLVYYDKWHFVVFTDAMHEYLQQ